MNASRRILSALALLLLAGFPRVGKTEAAAAAAPLVPLPREVRLTGPTITLEGDVALNAAAAPMFGVVRAHVAEWLASRGLTVTTNAAAAKTTVQLACDPSVGPGPEAYALDIRPGALIIRAAAANGAFYALQTLKQLAGPPAAALSLPAGAIRDAPRYGWRGMHLDVSRHFFDKAFVKRYLDDLAAYKLNVFHWHLVDGPGWRIEIKKYPRLTQVGAWRVDKRSRPWNWSDTEIHPKGRQAGDYGGFFTQDDIREIVAYARDRFITVVPEIEMPGHSYAALVAYPQFACEGSNVIVDGLHGRDMFCIGHPGTVGFLTDILAEILPLFPSKYIHIGADEVSRDAWEKCPRCRALIQRERLKSVDELQSYFVKRIEAWLNARGRTLIGWDEIIEGGLPPRAAVMVWRNMKHAATALRQGHPVVLSPTSCCYFDYMYSDAATEPPGPKSFGHPITLRTVYSMETEPPDLTPAQRELILGAQGNVWTEFIQTPDHVEYMIFPRMCALAEVVWSDPASRNWEDFLARLRPHRALWDAQKIRYRAASFEE